MPNFASGGTEWGRYVRETDPLRNFADSFISNFKEGMAYKLAEKKAKLDQQMKAEEQKALDAYRQEQLKIEYMKHQATLPTPEDIDWQKKQRGFTEQESQLKIQKGQKELDMMGQEKEPSWEEKQRIAQGWARIKQEGEKQPPGAAANLDDRARIINKVGGAYMSNDPNAQSRAAVMYQLNEAQTQEEAKQIYENNIGLFPETVIVSDKDLSMADFQNLANYVIQSFSNTQPQTVKSPIGNKPTKPEADNDPLKVR